MTFNAKTIFSAILIGLTLHIQTAGAGTVDDFLNAFKFNGYANLAAQIATDLWFALAILSLVLFLIQSAMAGTGWAGLFTGLMWFMIVRMTFLVFIEHPEWWRLITDSWIASANFVTGSTDVSPTEIFSRAVDVGALMVKREAEMAGVLSPTIILVGIIAIFVVLFIGWFACIYLFTLVHAYRLSAEALILLGFGGAAFTADIALAFIRGLIGIGFSLFFLITLTGFMIDHLTAIANALQGSWCIPLYGCLSRAPFDVYFALLVASAAYPIVGFMSLKFNPVGGGLGGMSALGATTMVGGMLAGAVSGGLGRTARIIAKAVREGGRAAGAMSNTLNTSPSGAVGGSGTPGIVPGRKP